jgi:hypothetical protein
MNIAEAKQLQDKQMVTQLSGRVTRVGQIRKGEGEYGPWSVQDFDLEDATGKIRINAWNKPALGEFMGKLVVMTPTRSDKGWNGLTVIDHEYNGQVTKQIKLTGVGVIEEMPASPAAGAAAMTESEAKAFQPAPVLNQSNGNGKITWGDYMTAMKAAHKTAAFLEQEDAHARAALVNTVLIAFSKGQVALPTQEDLDKEVPF